MNVFLAKPLIRELSAELSDVPRSSPCSTSNSEDSLQRMQCMEVWGGNRPTDSAFKMPGLRIRVYSRPFGSADSGGDVYYLSSCASGRVSRLLLADVCGHGASAAQAAENLRDLMRATGNFIDHGRVVAGVNHQFGRQSNNGGFATALVTTFFSPTRTLTLCNAGHPQPIIYRAATAQWAVHEAPKSRTRGAHNLPLGLGDETRFDNFKTKLANGDLLLAYTDALAEVRTATGLLGAHGLAGILNKLGTPQPNLLIPDLLKALSSTGINSLDHDDVTVMLVEATESRVRVRDTLAAPFRYLRSLF